MTEKVVRDPDGPDYEAVEIPDCDPSDYSFRERRAELLQRIERAGHPTALPAQTELASRYGVSQQQISKDFDRLAEYGAAQMFDRERWLFETDMVVRRAIAGLLEEEEWRAAAKTALEAEEWREEAVELVELAERVEEIANSQPSAGSTEVQVR